MPSSTCLVAFAILGRSRHWPAGLPAEIQRFAVFLRPNPTPSSEFVSDSGTMDNYEEVYLEMLDEEEEADAIWTSEVQHVYR